MNAAEQALGIEIDGQDDSTGSGPMIVLFGTKSFDASDILSL